MEDNFRDYNNSPNHVIETYKMNHTYQTVNYVRSMHKKYFNFDTCKMTIWEAIEKLNNIIDESDPDLDLPQIIHALQTAEAIRKVYPDKDWLHLVGLIHDLGKVLSLEEFGSLPQWSVVGDTFPVGCQFSKKIVYPEFFKYNPDYNDKRYNTKYGIYTPNCGLDNLLFSFGHDEYMYQVLIHNKCMIPKIGLDIIRYHSFYPLHKDNEYEYLLSENDYKLKEELHNFSKFDLYTKSNISMYDIDSLKEYYQGLIDKYFNNDLLCW